MHSVHAWFETITKFRVIIRAFAILSLCDDIVKHLRWNLKLAFIKQVLHNIGSNLQRNILPNYSLKWLVNVLLRSNIVDKLLSDEAKR